MLKGHINYTFCFVHLIKQSKDEAFLFNYYNQLYLQEQPVYMCLLKPDAIQQSCPVSRLVRDQPFHPLMNACKHFSLVKRVFNLPLDLTIVGKYHQLISYRWPL